MHRRCLLLMMMLCVLPVSGARLDAASADERYTVVTTIAQITDIVREVAGDRAEVVGLMKEGVDPHLYKPTRRDVVALQGADVIFYNGLMLEGKMGDSLVKVARKGKPVHAVTELLDQDGYVITDEADHFDPHVWMDVKGWMEAVRVVAKALGDFDPAGRATYARNADRYLVTLAHLDTYAREVLGSIPARQRVLVTAHDAFGYLGRAYGLEVRGIQGISTESEAGLRDVNELVKFLADRQIAAVFVETSVADKNVRALIEGSRAIDHQVKIGGSLFSDAMGAPGTREGTYVGMIDHNVSTIAAALGGHVPKKGFRGWLEQRRSAE